MRSLTLSEYQQRIGRVVDHIEHHLDDDLDIETLAKLSAFSPYHFHRVFRGMVGETVKQFVKRVRLERAAFQLNFANRSVTEVALDSGYASHEAFTRAFRTQFGCAPRDYSQSMTAAKSRNYAPAVPQMTVSVRSRPPTRILYVRSVGPVESIAEAFATLFRFAEDRELPVSEGGLGVSYDDPVVTDPAKMRFDAALPTKHTAIDGDGPVLVRTIPGGTFAVTTYRGPYTDMHGAYVELLGRWFPRSGREPANTGCLEFYRNDPRTTPPVDLLTDIWVRIAEA